MTFFDELGLRAAEQLEASVGAYVALASYKRLLGADEPIRGRAAYGALRAAVDLDDMAEVALLLPLWADEKAIDVDASGLALRLLAKHHPVQAAELARAEVARRPTPEAAYIAARIDDARRSRDALSAWDEAIVLAKKQDHPRILSASVARWLELALYSTEPPLLASGIREAVASRAELVDLAVALPHERLLVARARLLSASKFKRAGALSMLVDLAKTAFDPIRRSAIAIAAAHADASAGRLDPVEADRVRAAIALWPLASECEAALARAATQSEIDRRRRDRAISPDDLDALVGRIANEAPEMKEEAHRVRALFAGGSAAGARSHDGSGGGLEARLTSLGIDTVAAIVRGNPGDAARALVRAREALPPVAAVPEALHVAAEIALTRADAPLRRAAAMFLTRAIERSFTVPPSGFAPPAFALARAGFFAEARALFAEARRLKEPGAARALAEIERKLAYEAYAKGDRSAALEGLRASRALFAEADRTTG